MSYQTNEMRLDLPEIVNDMSVNVLSVTDGQHGVPYQIIINRDALLSGENLEQCFERQVGQLTRQTQGFKEVSKATVQIGPDKIEALEIESSFKQSNKTFHQIQAMWVTQAPQMLVLTLSSQVAIDEEHRKTWRAALASVQMTPPTPKPEAA